MVDTIFLFLAGFVLGWFLYELKTAHRDHRRVLREIEENKRRLPSAGGEKG